MFSDIISLINNWWDYIKPYEVIHTYEEGVLYRLGKDIKTVTKSQFKIPFLDLIQKDIVVTQTLTIPAQTIITKDLKEITTKTVVKYNIFDVRLFQTKVYDRVDALSDTAMIIVKDLITTTNSSIVHTIDNEITKKLKVQAKKWGIDIENASLTDISKTRSIRLFNENIINA